MFHWKKSPSPNVQQYAVQWTVNAGLVGAASVPQSAAGDTGGYAVDFASANPSVVLKVDDMLGASVAAVDTVHGLSSPPDVAAPFTIPAEAPLPPTDAVITLS